MQSGNIESIQHFKQLLFLSLHYMMFVVNSVLLEKERPVSLDEQTAPQPYTRQSTLRKLRIETSRGMADKADCRNFGITSDGSFDKGPEIGVVL